MNQLTSLLPLPQLAIQMYPIVGSGLVTEELIPNNRQYRSPEQAMADWRSLHSAERSPFRCLFWMEARGETATIHFLTDLCGKRKKLVGKTVNDRNAAKLLIANWRAGCYLTSIRWELYEDPACENLIDMGRFDQWDLLLGIDKSKLESLVGQGIAPKGDWDFDKLFFSQKCGVCNREVLVNYIVFNIDSVVCAECGNRPFLATSVHNMLDMLERIGDSGIMERAVTHAFGWISGANSKFGQVRLNATDLDGVRLRRLWDQTPMAKAMEAENEEKMRLLVEGVTGFNFEMYRSCCEKMHKALTGEERFGEEHQIVIDFVLRTTELLRVRQLATETS